VLWGPLHYSPIEMTCVLRVPLHFHKLKGCRVVAGPAALFTNSNSSVLEVPLHSSQMERTVCCGSLCTKGPCFAGSRYTIQNGKDIVLRGPRLCSQMERTVCCGSSCTIHKQKGQYVAGPTTQFTNGKDNVLRGPRLYSQMERTVCCGSLLPRATWTGPSLTSLKMAMAS
jgi:hypothetical protein